MSNYYIDYSIHKSLHKKNAYLDRYIPNRTVYVKSSFTSIDQNDQKTQYTKYLQNQFASETLEVKSKNIQPNLIFSNEKQKNTFHQEICQKIHNRQQKSKKIKTRTLFTQKVWDAPGVVNDYYSHLIDWSNDNSIALGLSQQLYLTFDWGHIQLVNRVCRNVISSVKYHPRVGELLAIGSKFGQIQLIDTYKLSNIRYFNIATQRIGTLIWNGSTLIAGGKNKKIIFCDIKVKKPIVSQIQQHKGQICGFDISQHLLASGSNDNTVCLWDLRMTKKYLHKLIYHKAAIKALSFCPWNRNILATGGGLLDGRIAFWNIISGKLNKSFQTNSMISCLIWNKNYNQILSSHGSPNNQISMWKYESDRKISQLCGHGDKILDMAISPQRKHLVSISADETLRLWNLDLSSEQKIGGSRIQSGILKY